jgi:hypothetical protein
VLVGNLGLGLGQVPIDGLIRLSDLGVDLSIRLGALGTCLAGILLFNPAVLLPPFLTTLVDLGADVLLDLLLVCPGLGVLMVDLRP